MKIDRTLKSLLLAIAILMGAILLRPFLADVKVSADTVRFDFVQIISPMYLYQGDQGILVLDKRNGNVWFIAKGNDSTISFRDPVFVVRLPLEKLNQSPQQPQQ